MTREEQEMIFSRDELALMRRIEEAQAIQSVLSGVETNWTQHPESDDSDAWTERTYR